jgi:hypothetical protein
VKLLKGKRLKPVSWLVINLSRDGCTCKFLLVNVSLMGWKKIIEMWLPSGSVIVSNEIQPVGLRNAVEMSASASNQLRSLT